MGESKVRNRLSTLVEQAAQQHHAELASQVTLLSDQVSEIKGEMNSIRTSLDTLVPQVRDIGDCLKGSYQDTGLVGQVQTVTKAMSEVSADMYDLDTGVIVRVKEIELNRDACMRKLAAVETQAKEAEKQAQAAKEANKVTVAKAVGYFLGASAVGSVLLWVATLVKLIHWN